MRIFVMRHGVAAPRDGRTPDEDRCLTEEGRKRTRKAAQGLSALGERVDRIFTSPLPRARETAEIAHAVLGVEVPLEVTPDLLPGGRAEAVVALMRRSGGEAVLLVGHEPDLSSLVSTLVWGSPEGDIEVKKASVICVDLPPDGCRGHGRLVWALPPKALRRLANGRDSDA